MISGYRENRVSFFFFFNGERLESFFFEFESKVLFVTAVYRYSIGELLLSYNAITFVLSTSWKIVWRYIARINDRDTFFTCSFG